MLRLVPSMDKVPNRQNEDEHDHEENVTYWIPTERRFSLLPEHADDIEDCQHHNEADDANCERLIGGFFCQIDSPGCFSFLPAKEVRQCGYHSAE